MRTSRVAAALSLAGAISLAAVPAQAAPLTSLSAAAKPAAQDSHAIQVRWGGWHGGWGGWHGGWGGLGFGIGALAAGALIGAAIASPSYYYGGYYPYYGGSPYYSYGYGYPYGWGYSTTYYPAYSYRSYRPYRHFAFGYRYHRPHRHFYVAHRPVWRHSFAMVGARHHHRHHHHWR